jgi:hypothetical protein
MKISKREYLLAKSVYHNFFTLCANGAKTKYKTPADVYADYSNPARRNIGRHLVATLRRCKRIIREYEAQNK